MAILAVVTTILLQPWTAPGAVYELKGYISAFSKDDLPSSSNANFVVTVSNYCWFIQLNRQTTYISAIDGRQAKLIKRKDGTILQQNGKPLNLNGRERNVKELVSTGFDGTNVYTILEKTVGNGGTNYFSGLIQPSKIPTENSPYPFTPVLWFAFASSGYFDASDTNSLKIPPVFSSSEEGVPVYASCTFFKQRDVNIPKSANFIDQGFLLVGRNKYMRPKPFDEGFVVATYNVITTENDKSADFPTGFELDVFRPVRGGKTTNDLVLSRKYTCVVTNLVFGCETGNFRPETTNLAPLLIADYRFSPQPYYYQANSWIAPGKLTNGVAFQNWIRNHSKPLPAMAQHREDISHTKRIIVLVVLGLLTIGGLLAIFTVAFKHPESN